MPALRVYWNRAQGNSWADFFSVDLDDPHFHGLEGVFVVWKGGSQPAAISVGQGELREALRAQRENPAIEAFRGQPLFVAWAKVERSSRPGVTRFLMETLKPKVAGPPPSAPPIDVNLPGRGDEAPPDAGTAPPRQLNGNGHRPAAAPERRPEPAPERRPAPEDARGAPDRSKLMLQGAFDEMLARGKENGKGGGFFGGGGGRPKEDEEKVVVELVQLVMKTAVKMKASDVHLEPLEHYLRVRFRLDGMLEEVLHVPGALNLRVVSHIRVMCGLDPEKGVGTGKPEDGRMAVNVDGQEADMRLSTFPTPHGDKAVLRLIPRSSKVPTLDEVGLEPKSVELLKSLIARPQGMFIVTGPTGSGKSTTLYTILQHLNTPQRNIVTLEDPIEKKIPGVAQGMIQPKSGFGFAEGLRAILRQDPNVIMVGEIRDHETAEIALSASLTGHMLFTTLHTVSALGAITRLVDMGMEPFLIASALTAVSAQRLARAICPDCARPHEAGKDELADLIARVRKAGLALPDGLGSKLMAGAGCSACRGTGYKGRVLLFEVVSITPGLREAVLRKGSIDELKAAAHKDGMEPLLLDGLRKAAAGKTTLSEILRVVDSAD